MVVREEGVSALYGGLTAHLLRVVPNTAVMFLGYELVVHLSQLFQRAKPQNTTSLGTSP